MTTRKLRLVSFGAACRLTRDNEEGNHLEMQILPSRTYVG